jgi:tetratricopeptide (TPR) repeat protein
MAEDHEMFSFMTSRQLAVVALLALLSPIAAVRPAAAQQSRMRVLVPSFQVTNPRSRAGAQLADHVRRQINAMATHAPADGRAIRDALRKFDLREEQMTCTQWMQLASQIEASLVLCGTLDEATGRVAARFVNLAGDAFEVPEFTMQSPEQAAQQVVQAFGTYTRQLALVTFCYEHVQSQSWTQALDACDQALQLNPNSVSAHYQRGSTLTHLDRTEEALDAFRTVLRLDPLNQDAMLHAGILAAKLERQDESQDYFRRYLELNPGNVQVRLTIATDLANAGDPAGALRLVEDAMNDPEASGTLWEYAGHFAMNAGIKVSEASAPGATSEEANRFFRAAIRHYGEAMQRRGDSVDVAVYGRLMMAHHRTGDLQRALEYGRQATTRTADDAQTWLVYADVLSSANRLNDALQAFDRAAAINPNLPNIAARKTMMLLEAGRLSDAVAAARSGVQRGDIQGDVVENLSQRMTQMGFQQAQAGRFEQALPYYAAAREIGRTSRSLGMANFFHGYTLIRQGEPIIKQGNNAAAGRRAKPLFEEAKRLLENAGGYSEQAANRAQLLQQVQQFIDVADALIKAGR